MLGHQLQGKATVQHQLRRGRALGLGHNTCPGGTHELRRQEHWGLHKDKRIGAAQGCCKVVGYRVLEHTANEARTKPPRTRGTMLHTNNAFSKMVDDACTPSLDTYTKSILRM